MPPLTKKPRAARFYLNEENDKILQEFSAFQLDLEESKLLSILVSAALRAVKENGFKLPLPLKLKVLDGGGTALSRRN